MPGDVTVKLPAAQKYDRMAEVAAAHAATHQGFPPTAVTELKQAVKEAMLLLLDPAHPDGTVAIDLQSKAGIVTVEAHLDDSAIPPIPEDRISRFASVAESLVDSWKLDPDDHRLLLQKAAPGGGGP
ncbi:hypothetical protein [Candidatus Poriferisocius sp.]|uniref:hypothetical protein n=1 Tax=Candidatus Poriferisocius sp. TaxID=3101276 RepID=UPI003B5B2A11